MQKEIPGTVKIVTLWLGMDVLGRLQWQQVDGVLRIDLLGQR